MNEEMNEEVKEVKPKRSWVKRHKILIIVVIVLIAPIIGFIGFIYAWNAGMGLPWGYRIEPPLTEGKHNILRFYQFIEDNPEGGPQEKVYFRYKEEKFRMQRITGKPVYSIYKEADDTKIGDFIIQEEENPEWSYGSVIFYDDHYIYYEFVQTIKRYYFEWSFQGTANVRYYSKYTFYRFDLDTGSNEKISIKLFVEKVNKYDERIKIK